MAKTAADRVSIYCFDSCVFLSLINEHADRFRIIEALLEDAENKQCEVHSSILSVSEVAFGEQEKKGRALSDAVERKIDKLWHPSSPVRLIDVHPIIANESRRLIRQAMTEGWTKKEDWSLKPPDAIHFATSISLKRDASDVVEMFTYDDRLLKLNDTLGKTNGIKICKPYLKQGRIGVL